MTTSVQSRVDKCPEGLVPMVKGDAVCHADKKQVGVLEEAGYEVAVSSESQKDVDAAVKKASGVAKAAAPTVKKAEK